MGDDVYNDAASIIFGSPEALPQLAAIRCWDDEIAVIGYELQYTDGVIYKRVGTATLPQTPKEMSFSPGQYISGIGGSTDTEINSLIFKKNDGEVLTCGNTDEGFAFADINGLYVIGVDGYFSNYLNKIKFKTLPESAA